MPVLKQIQRSATIAFSPNAPFLATGSVSGAVDASFSTDATLEVYRVEFATRGENLRLAGGIVKVAESFECLAWGALRLDPVKYPAGLIAGGLSDGSIGIWNADAILKSPTDSSDVPSALIATLRGHSKAVRGLEFNANSPNLLASGSDDGEVVVWDLTNPAAANSFKLGGSSNAASSNPDAARPGIGPMAWNWRFPKILAVGMSNGTCLVWDLGKEKPRPVVSLRNPAGPRRLSGVAWHPSEAWHIVVSSDDDASPELQIWDLRNQREPAATLRGHRGGVLGLAWCPQDPTFLLSSGRDDRTVVWDTVAREELLDVARAGPYDFQVAWSPTNPGVFATANYDGKVSLYALATCADAGTTAAAAGGGDFTAGLGTSSTRGPPKMLKRVPTWLKRPAACHMGFGGRLAVMTNSAAGDGGPTGAHVEVRQVITEGRLVEASEQFEAAARSQDKATLRDFCAHKAQGCHGEEADTWSFLQILFEDNAQQELLRHLGFEDMLPPPEPAVGEEGTAAVADNLGRLSTDDASLGPASPADLIPEEHHAPAGVHQTRSGEDFFSALGGADGTQMLDHFRSMSHTSAAGNGEGIEGPGEPGPGEQAIQRALYAGNYAAAVDAALEAERYADALSIAALAGAGGDLWVKAQKRYQASAPRPYMMLARCIMDNDFKALIGARPLSGWKETLAILATYAGGEWTQLVRGLAERLAAHGMGHPATLCWIAAGSVDEAVQNWTYAAKGASASVDTLQALMERTVVLGVAAGTSEAAPAAGALIARYAGLLAAQGRLLTALQYLDLAPGEAQEDTAVLRERIYRAGGPEVAAAVPIPPPFPFVGEEVTAAPTGAQQNGDAFGSSRYGGGYGQQSQQSSSFGASFQEPAKPAAAPTYGSSAPSWNAPPAAAPQAPGYGHQPTAGSFAPPSGGFGAPPAPAGFSGAAPQQQGFGAQLPPQSSSYGGGSSFGGGAPSVFQPAVPPPQKPPQPVFAPVKSSAAAIYNPAPQPSLSSAGSFGAPQPPPQQQQPQQPSFFTPQPAPPRQTAPSQAAAYAPPPKQTAPSQAASYVQRNPQQAGGYGSSAAPYQAAAPPQQAPPQSQPNMYMPSRPSAAAPPQAAYRTGAQTGAPPPAGVFVPSASPRGGPVSPTFGAGSGPAPPPQPQAPAAPQLPPAPAGPPANITVQNVDVSKVPVDMRPVVTALRRLFEECAAAVAGQPGKKREVDDNSKKLGGLFWHINAGDIAPRVADELKAMAAALSAGDLAGAQQVQMRLTTTAWTECSGWLTTVKRLLKTRATFQ